LKIPFKNFSGFNFTVNRLEEETPRPFKEVTEITKPLVLCVEGDHVSAQDA
jgi:hypothetical protein